MSGSKKKEEEEWINMITQCKEDNNDIHVGIF